MVNAILQCLRVTRMFDAAGIYSGLRRHGLVCVSVFLIGLTVQRNFGLGVNLTESLPHHLFLIVKGASVHRGDLMAFRWQGGGPYRAGVVFVKIAAGVPGDVVTRVERQYFVNGMDVGLAKRFGRAGEPL